MKHVYIIVVTQTNSTNNKSITGEKEVLIGIEPSIAALEKVTPMELKADNDIISQCQDYLEIWGNTLAMYGALGSGKRTLAAQVALRLAKKDSK